MSTPRMAKGIAIFLGICIIACSVSIVVKLCLIHKQNSALSGNKVADISLPADAKIDTVKTESGKIYLTLKRPDKTQLIIFNEKTAEKLMTLNFVKGEK